MVEVYVALSCFMYPLAPCTRLFSSESKNVGGKDYGDWLRTFLVVNVIYYDKHGTAIHFCHQLYALLSLVSIFFSGVCRLGECICDQNGYKQPGHGYGSKLFAL